MEDDLTPEQSDLLAELAEAFVPPIEPDEITTDMIAAQTGAGYDQIRRIMARKVETGEYTRRMVLVDGRQRYAYRKAK